MYVNLVRLLKDEHQDSLATRAGGRWEVPCEVHVDGREGGDALAFDGAGLLAEGEVIVMRPGRPDALTGAIKVFPSISGMNSCITRN